MPKTLSAATTKSTPKPMPIRLAQSSTIGFHCFFSGGFASSAISSACVIGCDGLGAARGSATVSAGSLGARSLMTA
jgi:hypothetical protein